MTNFYSSTSRNPFSVNKEYHGIGGKILYIVNDQDIKETGLLNSLNGELHILNSDMDWVFQGIMLASNTKYSATMNFIQGSPFINAIIRHK